MMSNRQQGRAAVNSSGAAALLSNVAESGGISASFVEEAIVVMEMQTNSCTARTGQARCVESSQAGAGVCTGACVQVGAVVMQPARKNPAAATDAFFFPFFFLREDRGRQRG